MNIEKMNFILGLFAELKDDGVIGIDFHENVFHVGYKKLISEPDLRIEERSSSRFPYQVYVEHDGLKIFSLIEEEQLKEFPQLKGFRKELLLKKLEELESEEEVTA
jgi:hypothetical protein